MGRQTTIDIANTDLPLDRQVAWHLQSNTYPPIPLVMVDTCVEAIELARLGYTDTEIELPNGESKDGSAFQITWNGQDKAPVSAIIESHNLHGFIQDGEE